VLGIGGLFVTVRGVNNIVIGEAVAKRNIEVYRTDDKHDYCDHSKELEVWLSEPIYYRFFLSPPFCRCDIYN